ncbi:MAG: glutamate--cysteine ligase [Pseudomonadota bacterium]
MGIEIDRSEFDSADYERFVERLELNLSTLRQCLANPDFGRGPASLGAELEMYIIDQHGRPLFLNQELQAEAADPQLTLELNRYNLEYNLSPYCCAEKPFLSTENEINDKLTGLRSIAARHGGRIVPIGILPTLKQSDFGAHCITDLRRFHALVAQCIRRRRGKFRIDINGAEPLQMALGDITLEGANTSFQVHYRVQPDAFADTFNAVQLATPLALAIGANSPTLFGHSLWHETRVPLFKQSIDTRHINRYGWNEPARVSCGNGWVRRSALELFEESVRLYRPYLPVCDGADEDGGAVPRLAELRLHQGTVWLWNRPVYDDAQGGMLRIELRALPAGPTPVDMVANAAFLIGLAEGLRPQINQLLPALPFKAADYNFYRAAQFGLDADLVWPELGQSGCKRRSVLDIIASALPVAAEGLGSIGIEREEIDRYLGVIERRLAASTSGAIWQQRVLSALKPNCELDAALHSLLERYHENSVGGEPVADWRI